jgi:hypothetical protein
MLAYIILLSPAVGIFLYAFITKDANPTPSYMFCSSYLKPSSLTSVISFIIPFTFLLPCWTVTFCYFEIGRKAYKNLGKLKLEAIEKSDNSLLASIKNQNIKLTIQLVMIFILFNVNFMPSYIAWILKIAIGYKRTPIVDAVAFELVELSLTIDPIITITFQPELNHELNFLIIKSKLKIKHFICSIFQYN